MSNFSRRLARLEELLDAESDGPSDAQRLRDALDRIQEQRRLGTEPPDETPALEGPLGQRLAYALQRAAEARRLMRS